MVGFLQMAKDELTARANPAGVYVDFTMGRGRDTLFLCRLAPKGTVYAFDVQQEALDSTAALLAENKITNATLILESHERFARHV
ncbi:MAG: class I SAM-dependent methyltransferase, partial [Oscillospiraceae bacterium]